MKVQQPKYSIEYCLKGISFAAANALGIWQSWLLYWCCSKQYLVPSDSKRPILVCRGIHYWASKEAVKFPFLSVLKETSHLSGTTQKNFLIFFPPISPAHFSLLFSHHWPAHDIHVWTRCLKITQKVSFYIASYVYILSGQKFIKCKKRFLKTWSLRS